MNQRDAGGGSGDNERLPTDEITFATAAATGADEPRRTPLPAAHEVRRLRAEVQQLERRLGELSGAWRAALLPPGADARVLRAACAAAREKAMTARVERENGALRDQLMQQQLFYASLQDQLVRRAPLSAGAASATALFARLHTPMRLCARAAGSTSDRDGDKEREDPRRRQLRLRLERGVREADSIMDTFTRELLPRASPVLPFSSTSVAPTTIPPTADGVAAAGTLVSSVFVCKLPPESDVARVFHMVVDNLKQAPFEMSRKLGIRLDFSMLDDELGPDSFYGQVTRQDGSFEGVMTSVAFTAELVHADLGVALMDFVDEDDERVGRSDSRAGAQGNDEPPLSIDTCSLVTVSRMKRTAEDEGASPQPVLLRRLRVHRYNLPPHSPTLHRDLELHMPFLNGDLHMEMLLASVAREGANADAKKLS